MTTACAQTPGVGVGAWNRVFGWLMVALSLVALGTILIGLLQPPQPPDADEGTLAHIFQLAMGLLLPVGGIFVATVDWSKPGRVARPLLLAGAIAAVAFALLYRFEHP